MTATQELIALAATIADDLDVMAALPADRITHIAIGQPDLDKPERVQFTLGDGFQHPTPELQTTFATAAAWLRDTLPTLAAEHDHDTSSVDEDSDEYQRYFPEQVEEILGMKLTANAHITAYWRDAELPAVLANRDINVMFTLAQTFTAAWIDYLHGNSLSSNQARLNLSLAYCAERAGRHDIDMLEDKLRVLASRDDVVRAAFAADLSKNRIHTISGIARTTIDRILGAQDGDA